MPPLTFSGSMTGNCPPTSGAQNTASSYPLFSTSSVPSTYTECHPTVTLSLPCIMNFLFPAESFSTIWEILPVTLHLNIKRTTEKSEPSPSDPSLPFISLLPEQKTSSNGVICTCGLPAILLVLQSGCPPSAPHHLQSRPALDCDDLTFLNLPCCAHQKSIWHSWFSLENSRLSFDLKSVLGWLSNMISNPETWETRLMYPTACLTSPLWYVVW